MTGGEEGATRTFELLANETRCGIVRALGDASGEEGYATLAFSELQEAVGVEDNGKFNYHLKQLTDEFVEDKEDGYGLTLAGLRAYQTIVAHETGQDVEVEPFELPGPEPCNDCGAPLQAWYVKGRFHCACSECGSTEMRYPVSTADFDLDDPNSLLDAFNRRLSRDYFSMLMGVCPYCAGPVNRSLAPPEGHWDDKGMRSEEVLSHLACDRCAWFIYGALAGTVVYHPLVSSFLAERGVDVFASSSWEEPYEWEVTVEEDSPWRVRVTYELDDEGLDVVVDEDIGVLEHRIHRSDADEPGGP